MKKEIIKKILTGATVIFVIGSLVGTLAYLFPQRGQRSNQLPPEIQNALKYINQIVQQQGQNVVLNSWEEKGGLYVLNMKIGEQEYQSFVTKDGKYLFPYGIDLTEIAQLEKAANQETAVQVEKRERPDVKLFVMSYCPFGLQMEKAILPVWQLLKDKVDIGVYFVDYIMHGKEEMEENLRQYCIQKEEKDKYLAYLACFVKEGKSEECLKEAKIDEEKINACWQATDKEFKISENFQTEGYPPFNIHQELNEKYGVRGSPTLVINDVVLNTQRSPESVKKAICGAFLNPPPECEQKLEEQPASAGFGLTGGSSSGGSCQ